jgi:aminoglycoside phosphotransferase (APT) family kinase protein
MLGEASPTELLHETLSGSLGVGSLRDLALDPLPHGVRGLLADVLPGWNGSLDRLVRTKYKPGRKLTAYYQLTPGDEARHVAVTWTNDSVRVLVSPDDPAMPQLAALHDRRHLTDLLGFAGRIDTIRYRPGQRHVLQVSSPDRVVYVKTDRDDSGARAVPVVEALTERITSACPGAHLAEPIRYSAADRAGFWKGAPGEPLWRRFAGGAPEARLTFLVGRALRVLHETPLDDLPAHDGPARDASVEIASTIRAGEHIAALLPEVGAQFRAIAEDVADDLARVPTEAPTFTHGDVKSDNVLASGNDVRLLDLDRSGPADPALDLAKFVADLRWWCGPDRRCAGGLIDSFLNGYGDADLARWERTVHLTRLFQLKLAARRCAVHDPAWETRVRSRVSAAAPVLSRGAR